MLFVRTYNDLNQYPVFPWVLIDYPTRMSKLGTTSAMNSASAEDKKSGSSAATVRRPPIMEIINAPHSVHHASIFRDLSKPIGALHPQRLESILERFQSFSSGFDSEVPPFHYGSHYSNAATVLFYLMRLEPFASLHIELQTGKFDYPDRYV